MIPVRIEFLFLQACLSATVAGKADHDGRIVGLCRLLERTGALALGSNARQRADGDDWDGVRTGAGRQIRIASLKGRERQRIAIAIIKFWPRRGEGRAKAVADQGRTWRLVPAPHLPIRRRPRNGCSGIAISEYLLLFTVCFGHASYLVSWGDHLQR